MEGRRKRLRAALNREKGEPTQWHRRCGQQTLPLSEPHCHLRLRFDIITYPAGFSGIRRCPRFGCGNLLAA